MASIYKSKNLSLGAELQKPTLFGIASMSGYCGDRDSEYPDLFSDIRLPDVSDWIKNVTMFSRSENFLRIAKVLRVKNY